MTVAVKFSDLMDAFEFVSVAGPFDNRAYVDLITGKIYLVSDELEFEEELPDDLEESDRYLAVPGKNELHLGSRLVERFVQERLPADAEEGAHGEPGEAEHIQHGYLAGAAGYGAGSGAGSRGARKSPSIRFDAGAFPFTKSAHACRSRRLAAWCWLRS